MQVVYTTKSLTYKYLRGVNSTESKQNKIMIYSNQQILQWFHTPHENYWQTLDFITKYL